MRTKQPIWKLKLSKRPKWEKLPYELVVTPHPPTCICLDCYSKRTKKDNQEKGAGVPSTGNGGEP